MNRIQIDVSREELFFILEALQRKYSNLIGYIHDCMIESEKPPAVSDIKKTEATVTITKAAPYGLKKDGTPAKRRGRKPAKAKK